MKLINRVSYLEPSLLAHIPLLAPNYREEKYGPRHVVAAILSCGADSPAFSTPKSILPSRKRLRRRSSKSFISSVLGGYCQPFEIEIQQLSVQQNFQWHSQAANDISKSCEGTGFSTTFLPSVVPYSRLYMWLRVLLTSRSLLVTLQRFACRVLHSLSSRCKPNYLSCLF